MSEETTTPDANQAVEDRAASIEESSTSTTGAADTAQESKPEGESIPKSRFNKVYWEKKQKEREVEELKAQLEKVQSSQQTEQPAGTTQFAETQKPTLEQFDYDDSAYYEALADWKAEQKIQAAFQARDEQAQLTKQQKEAEQINSDFGKKLADYNALHPEYNDAIEAAGGRAFAPHVNQAILHAENGPAIDHHLLLNPEIADRLSRMNSVQAAIEIGKIGAGLSAQPVQTSNAPPPIDTVGGGGNPVSDVRYSDKTSPADYYKAAMERKRAR